MRRIGLAIVDGAEHGETRQHGDDEEPDAKIDPADALALGARLRIAVFRGADQIFGRLLDQHVHLPAEIDRVVDLGNGVAVVLRDRGELGADGDIIGGERADLLQLLFVGRLVAQTDRGRHMLSGRGRVGAQPLQRTVDVGGRDGQTHLAHLDLHIAEIFGCAERFDGSQLLVLCDGALMRGPAVADLLLGEHAGDKQYAERRPDRELRANGEIEAQHLSARHSNSHD